MRRVLTGWRKGKGRRIAAVVGAAVLMTALTTLPGYAEADSLEEAVAAGFSATVVSPTDAEYEELGSAGAVLDFYLIAEAVPSVGEDAFTFGWNEAFNAQKAAWESAVAEAGEGEGPTAKNVRDLTQGLAGVVLADIEEYSTESTGESAAAVLDGVPVFTGALDEATALETPGLYLIIARGNAPAYKITAESGDISTAVPGETKLFQFAPMLVTVPQRGETALTDSTGIIYDFFDGKEIGEYSSGTGDTAAVESKWQNALTLNAKVAVTEKQKGSLLITKTLSNHEYVDFGGRIDQATFVFDVKVYKDKEKKEDEVVFRNVYSVVLDANKMTDVVAEIHDLPVGAKATVEEVYCGNYTPTTPKIVEIKEIIADEIGSNGDIETQNTAAFTNRYDKPWRGGGSVMNSYKAVDDDGTVHWDTGKATQAPAGGETSGAFTPVQAAADDTPK